MKHKIIMGDCSKVLEKIPDKSVHLVVTSPPYNISIGNDIWEDKLPLNEYIELTKSWLKESYRILVDGGIICVNLPFNGRNNIAFLHYKIMRELGFNFQNHIAWIKWDNQRKDKFAVSKRRLEEYKYPRPQNPFLINVFEIVIVMQKSNRRLAGKQDLTPDEFNRWKYNVWFIPPLTDRTHPAPYPLELPKRLIKLYSFVGNTVLDPFLGTGTTTRAAMMLKRNSIGIELSPEYIKMAREKMELGSNSVSIENAYADRVCPEIAL